MKILRLIICIAVCFQVLSNMVYADTISLVENMKTKGAIHKIEIESNSVWVDDEFWYMMNADRKEKFIYTMSDYFKRKRGYERVTVYSWRTGKVLAKTTWTGIKYY